MELVPPASGSTPLSACQTVTPCVGSLLAPAAAVSIPTATECDPISDVELASSNATQPMVKAPPSNALASTLSPQGEVGSHEQSPVTSVPSSLILSHTLACDGINMESSNFACASIAPPPAPPALANRTLSSAAGDQAVCVSAGDKVVHSPLQQQGTEQGLQQLQAPMSPVVSAQLLDPQLNVNRASDPIPVPALVTVGPSGSLAYSTATAAPGATVVQTHTPELASVSSAVLNIPSSSCTPCAAATAAVVNPAAPVTSNFPAAIVAPSALHSSPATATHKPPAAPGKMSSSAAGQLEECSAENTIASTRGPHCQGMGSVQSAQQTDRPTHLTSSTRSGQASAVRGLEQTVLSLLPAAAMTPPLDPRLLQWPSPPQQRTQVQASKIPGHCDYVLHNSLNSCT